MDWQTKSTDELLEELDRLQSELRAHHEAYDAQLRRGTQSLSLSDRAAHIYDLGRAIDGLKMLVAERYVQELESEQKMMHSVAMKLDMLTIAEIEEHFARASEFMQAREYHMAVSEFNTVLRHNPLLGEAFYNRGLAFALGGQFPQAIADFSAALRLNPHFTEAYFNRGLAFGDLQQYSAAIADITEAIGLNPYNAAAYRERGIALRHEHRTDEALADLNLAIQLAPDDAATLYERALVYEAAGDYAQAAADCERALELRPGWKLPAQKIEEFRGQANSC